MELQTIAIVLWRRRLLALACAFLTALVGLVAMLQIAPTYQAIATVVLLPPTDPVTENENRLLDLDGMGQSVAVLIRDLTSKEVRQGLEGSTPNATYDITPDVTSSAPLLVVTVKGDRAGVQALMTRTLEEIPRRLKSIQEAADTPDDFLIVPLNVTRDKEPEPLRRPKIRLVAVLCVATLGSGLLLIAAVDSRLMRRRRRAQLPSVPAMSPSSAQRLSMNGGPGGIQSPSPRPTEGSPLSTKNRSRPPSTRPPAAPPVGRESAPPR